MIQNYLSAKSNKLIIFDRDDTLIVDKPGLKEFSKISWLPDRIPTLITLSDLGFDIAIATNQGAVAKKLLTLSELFNVHDNIAHTLVSNGISLVTIAFCPHHPKGVDKLLAVNCGCRKPAPGLIEEICGASKFQHSEIYLFGNSLSDIKAAENYRFNYVKSGLIDVKADFRKTIMEAIES